jgi:hypothetical protein
VSAASANDDAHLPAAASVSHRSAPTTAAANSKQRLIVDFLNAERLGFFLRDPIRDQDVLVSRYAGPHGGPWSVTHCVWTDARLIGVERRANKHDLSDKRLPITVRTSTTAVDPANNMPLTVAGGTQARLGKLCAAVAAAANAGSTDVANAAERFGLYFFSSVPLGDARSGRWIFLGANEAPPPKLVGAAPLLQTLLPKTSPNFVDSLRRGSSIAVAASPTGGGASQRRRSNHRMQRATHVDDLDDVSWRADGPDALPRATTADPGFFQPRRAMVTPGLDDGRRRVRATSSSSGSRPLPLVRRSTPSHQLHNDNSVARARSRGATPSLLRPADADGNIADRMKAREASRGKHGAPLDKTEWRLALADASAQGYLAPPPNARAGTAPHGGVGTRKRRAQLDTSVPHVSATEKLRIAEAHDLELVPSDPRATTAVRAVSRNQCTSNQLLRATKGGRALTPATTTYVGHKAFKASFVDRLLDVMDQQRQQPYSSTAGNDTMEPVPAPSGFASPSPRKQRSVAPLSPSTLERQNTTTDAASPSPARGGPAASPGANKDTGAASSPAGRNNRASSPSAASPGAKGGDTSAAAAQARATTAKREELRERYDPEAIFEAVMDGLYNVYAADLEDPTGAKDIKLLRTPAPVTRQPVSLLIRRQPGGDANRAGTEQQQQQPNSPTRDSASTTAPADAPELPATIEVALLPMEEHMQRELRALLKDAGVIVTCADSADGNVTDSTMAAKSSQPIVHFPRDQAAAARLKLKLGRTVRELSGFMRTMSVGDVTAVQRDVAESGDGLFHPVVKYAMRVAAATATLTGALANR